MSQQTERKFIDTIIELVNQFNGNNLTNEKINLIINRFYALKGTSFERAKRAVKEILNEDISSYEFAMEDSAAAMNSLQDLLKQMSAEADKWKKEQEN